MDKEQLGAPNQWLYFGFILVEVPPGASGPLDIVHPVHPLATPLGSGILKTSLSLSLEVLFLFFILLFIKKKFGLFVRDNESINHVTIGDLVTSA